MLKTFLKNKKTNKAFKLLEKEFNINFNVQSNKTLFTGALMLLASAIMNFGTNVPKYAVLATLISGSLLTLCAVFKTKKDYNNNMYNLAIKSGEGIDMFSIRELYKAHQFLYSKGVVKSFDDIRYYLSSVICDNAGYFKGEINKRELKKRKRGLLKEMHNPKEK